MQQLSEGTLLQGGKYKIERVLGQGGFGITYLATQVLLGREVCIKEFFFKQFCERDEGSSRVTLGTKSNRELVDKFMKKFIKEARTISQLDHSNIIRIHDIFEENGTAYYVMEYHSGGSLGDLVKDGKPLPETEAVRYITQIADAVGYIHKRNINHLDIKPGNILIDARGGGVLIDFGLSKQYDESGDQTSSTPVGISHGYAPMEQYNSGGVSTFTPQSDIYSLGATLYKLVTGVTPPQAMDIVNDGLPALPAHLSVGVKKAIEQAMQIRKIDRPATAEEFVALLSGGSASAEPSTDEATKIIAHPVEENRFIEQENDNECSVALVPVCSMGMYGFADKSGNEVISFKYHRAWDFREGRARVKLNGKDGYIDKSGNEVIPLKYDDAWGFSEGLAAVKLNDKYGFINKSGNEVISFKYDYASEFSEGLAAVKLNDKYGFIDKSGNEVISFKYDFAWGFREGRARVRLNRKYGFVDKSGNEVTPLKYYFASSFYEGRACVKLNGKDGYIDKSGNEVIPLKYDDAWGFSEGLALVELNNKYGFIDKSGNEVIPLKYDYAEKFSEGFAAVRLNGKYGFIDKSGKEVIPLKYDDVSYFSEGLARVGLNGEWFYIDKQGNMVK